MPDDRNIENGKVKIYAEAFLQCAGEDRDKVLEYDNQLHTLVDVCMANRPIMEMLANPYNDENEREQRAEEVFGPFDENIRPIIVTMAVRGDTRLVYRVSKQYTVIAERKLGAVIVDVTTAVELDDHLREVITTKLSKDFGKDVIIREHIDPEIIGGIIMGAHGRRIDASISKQLASARTTLASSPTGGER